MGLRSYQIPQFSLEILVEGSTSDMLPRVTERRRVVVRGVANAELFLDAHCNNNNMRQHHYYFQVLQANPCLYRQSDILRTH